MPEVIQANWAVLAVVLVLALVIGWWLLRRASSAPKRREHRPDVLDEGQAPAQRNQALIDAAPAAQIITPPPFSGAMAGVGEVVAVTAQDEVEELEARAAEMEVVPEVEAAPEAAPEPPVARAPVAAPQPEAKPVAAPPPPPAPVPQPEPEPEAIPAPRSEPSPPTPTPPAPAEAPAPLPPPAPAPTGGDDLARIKGLGPKLQALLPTLGITTFAQIAALSEADLDALDPQLGPFAGRPRRDSWVEQAGYLASGDVAGFEAKFGKV